MSPCLIAGDSIAVGTHMFYQECVLHGKGGLNSWQWNKRHPNDLEPVDHAIISLGTNDHRGVNSEKELRAVRAKIHAKRVYWILPYGNAPASGVPLAKIQTIITTIAHEHGDIVLGISSVQSDKIHPSWRGYRAIVNEVKHAQ